MRVVFDANVFVQAALSARGASFACLEAVDDGRVTLVTTDLVLAEVREVLERLAEKPKYRSRLSREAIADFMLVVRSRSELRPEPPHVFDLERDRDDELYIDLAVAASATYLTTRDDDLLDLMDISTATGADFRSRFPDVTIVDPPEFLRRLRAGG